MAPGALREVGQVENLGRKVQRDVFPDGRVTSGGAVQVTRALGLKTPKGLHALFQGNEQGSPVKRSRQVQESRRAPTGKHSPRGWIVKEFYVNGGDIEKGEPPVVA